MDDPYVYSGSTVLKNKPGIRNQEQLDYFERALVVQRMREGVPAGGFDLDHLRAIHRHLFQDVYIWAGEIRTVEISKEGHQFQFRKYIPTGMNDVHQRLLKENFLSDLAAKAFAQEAANIIGDVNYVHPFREGNGRTQMQYLKLLARRAGHDLDLLAIEPDRWLDASRRSHSGDYSSMALQIECALRKDR